MKKNWLVGLFVAIFFAIVQNSNAELLSAPADGSVVRPFGAAEILVSLDEEIVSVTADPAVWPGERFDFDRQTTVYPEPGVSTYVFDPMSSDWDLTSGEYRLTINTRKMGEWWSWKTYRTGRFTVLTPVPLIRILYPDTNTIVVAGEKFTFRWQTFGLPGGFSSVGICLMNEENPEFSCSHFSALEPNGGLEILTNSLNWEFPSGFPNGRYRMTVYPIYRGDRPGVESWFMVDSQSTKQPVLKINRGDEEYPSQAFVTIEDPNDVPRKWYIEGAYGLGGSWRRLTGQPVEPGQQFGIWVLPGNPTIFRAVEHKLPGWE